MSTAPYLRSLIDPAPRAVFQTANTLARILGDDTHLSATTVGDTYSIVSVHPQNIAAARRAFVVLSDYTKAYAGFPLRQIHKQHPYMTGTSGAIIATRPNVTRFDLFFKDEQQLRDVLARESIG